MCSAGLYCSSALRLYSTLPLGKTANVSQHTDAPECRVGPVVSIEVLVASDEFARRMTAAEARPPCGSYDGCVERGFPYRRWGSG